MEDRRFGITKVTPSPFVEECMLLTLGGACVQSCAKLYVLCTRSHLNSGAIECFERRNLRELRYQPRLQLPRLFKTLDGYQKVEATLPRDYNGRRSSTQCYAFLATLISYLEWSHCE